MSILQNLVNYACDPTINTNQAGFGSYIANHVLDPTIIFYTPCLFMHHLLCVLLHFVVFLCIFRN
jgi:hypothetical protein